MQPCGGCWAARRLLASSPAPPPADQSSLDAQRAHVERVLGGTTIVLFVASLAYIALTALYGCLRAARVIHAPPGSDDAPDPAPGTRDDTKRALQGIPVRLVVLRLPCDDDGGPKLQAEDEGGQDDAEEADECAVCLAEYAAGDEVRVLPACRHGFHRDCIDRWLITRAPTCPVCRAPLAAPDVEDAAGAGKDHCAAGHGGIALGVDVSREAPAASLVE